MDYFISRFNSFALDTQGLTADNLTEKTKIKFNHAEDSTTLVVCLPGWGQPLWSWKFVENYLKQKKCSFLAYDFPRPILSNSAELTRQCFEVISEQVSGDIRQLKNQHGFKQCVVVALSLASSFGSMIYKDNQDISDIILIAPGENLARDMWHGCRTQHLRKSYESQGCNLGQLEESWQALASEYNFPVQNAIATLFYGTQDKVIPVQFSSRLKDVLLEKGFKTSARFLNCGHYGLISRFLLSPQRFLTSI